VNHQSAKTQRSPQWGLPFSGSDLKAEAGGDRGLAGGTDCPLQPCGESPVIAMNKHWPVQPTEGSEGAV